MLAYTSGLLLGQQYMDCFDQQLSRLAKQQPEWSTDIQLLVHMTMEQLMQCTREASLLCRHACMLWAPSRSRLASISPKQQSFANMHVDCCAERNAWKTAGIGCSPLFSPRPPPTPRSRCTSSCLRSRTCEPCCCLEVALRAGVNSAGIGGAGSW